MHTKHNDKDAVDQSVYGLQEDDAVADDRFFDTPSPLTRDQVRVGYIPVPKLDRLMGLRDALVALKGPLADDPRLQENLQKRLFDEEHNRRVLGEVSGLVRVIRL